MAACDFTPIGARFSRLVVTSAYWRDKFHIKRVRCICDCGKETEASCQQLVNGIKKSCGCLRRDAARDYAAKQVLSGAVQSVDVGSRFGKLVVMSAEAVGSGSGRKIQCLCDCGTECLVAIGQLRTKRGTRSCGCLVGEVQRQMHALPLGEKFGKLTVMRGIDRRTANHRMVEAQCDCGKTAVVSINNLRTGHTTSCGCQKALTSAARTRHGHSRKGSRSRTYQIYRDMRTRCENPNYAEFHLYGGRGITVCERWRQGFEYFLADMGESPAGMTLERDRVNEGYSLENCRWATAAEQSINKRNNVFIEHEGRRMTVSQWAAELGLNASRMYYGVKQGWPPEKILAV